MRRYRFGMIAAPLAAAYVAVIVAAGLFALVTGDNTLLRWIVADGWTEIIPFVWWVELLVVAGGILQGWAYWQILRGRPAGEPHRGGTAVRLLRVALYLSVACDMIFRLPLPIPYRWWLGLLGELVNVAVVCLFFVVLAGVLPLPLRIVGLVAGLGAAVLGVMTTVVVGLAQDSLLNVVLPLPTHLVNLTWLVLVLVGQARDPRWSRATVGTGVAAAALSFLSPEGSFGFVSQGDADPIVVLMMLTQVLGVLWSVWEARSAHELANPPGPPSPRAAPTRAAPQPWPLVALAVVPPLIPAAVNLAQGMPVWIGPRGAVTGFFRDFAGPPASQMWVAVDLLVGVGAPAVLIVIVAVRRTRRLVRGAVWALTLAAAAGVVTAATTDTGQDWGHFPYLDEQRLRYYPEGLFVPDQNHGLQFGISPLWYSLALAVSALVLFVLYTRPHVIRPRHHVLVGAAGALTALCFLPAADHAHGPVTTPDDCTPRHRDPEADRERSDGARSFICDVRTSKVLEAADTMPDLALLEYGRRLCDIYTRNDPRELARVR